MRSIKSLLVGLVLAGILALVPAAAFAHGGGGHFGGGGGHFGGGGGHFARFAGHSFAGRSFAQHQGANFARHEDHFRRERHGFLGDPFWYDYPYYGYDYPYYGYYDDNAGVYSDGQSSPAEVTPSQETIIARAEGVNSTRLLSRSGRWLDRPRNGKRDSLVPIRQQASRYRSDRRFDIESAADQLTTGQNLVLSYYSIETLRYGISAESLGDR